MKKKVLFFIPTLGHGGAERVLVNLVNNLNEETFDITVQTIFDVGLNKKYLKPHIKYKSFFKHLFPGNVLLFKFIPAKLLYKVIIKDKYDIAVSYLEGSTNRIISACPYEDTKKVAWIHIELNTDKLFSIGYRNKKDAIKNYQNFDRIICVSETVKDIFEKSAGRKFDNIQVLYNTNETDVIKKMSLESVEDIVFDSNSVNICSVAKLMHTKGYDRLINVHKRLLDDGLKHNIYLIGCGELEKDLISQVNALGVNDTFHFLGFKENPYKYMRLCDLYVCSSRREGFSTAVTESLILGTPVVSTCCSGAYELLGKNNEYGIVTDNSEDGIYFGLKKILSDYNLLLRYKEKAKMRGERFSKEKTVKSVSDMLNSIK